MYAVKRRFLKVSLEQFYPEGTDFSRVADNADFTINGFLNRRQFIPDSLNCPYCLYRGRINDFIDARDGSNKHRSCKCPDCSNTIRRKTLVRTSTMTLQQYANWLYWTKRYDIDRKIKWDKLFLRMRNYCIASDFWPLYRAEKEKDVTRDNKPARNYSTNDESVF